MYFSYYSDCEINSCLCLLIHWINADQHEKMINDTLIYTLWEGNVIFALSSSSKEKKIFYGLQNMVRDSVCCLTSKVTITLLYIIQGQHKVWHPQLHLLTPHIVHKIPTCLIVK